MKQVIFGVVSAGILVIFIIVGLTISGRDSRQQEVEEGLNEAIETTVQTLVNENSYDINNSNEFIADFIQALSLQIESTSDVTANILKADADKGLLSIEVIETYKHPNGREGTVSCMKSVIFDKKEETPLETKTVTYYLSKEDLLNNTNPYKVFEIIEGDNLIEPTPPSEALGLGTFKNWNDSSDYLADFSQKVVDNLSYYASFE